MTRIVQHHLGALLKFPKDIAQILVEQQKNNTTFMAAWQILIEEHQKASHHIDHSDIVQIEVDQVKQSFVAFHPPMPRLSLFFQQIRQHTDFIYQLYLMLNEWRQGLKLNDYPEYYLNLLDFFLKIKHHQLEDIWLIEDLLNISSEIIEDVNSANSKIFKELLEKIHQDPKFFFKANQDNARLLEFMPLSDQGYQDCCHYLLEHLEFYILDRSHIFLNQMITPCYSKQNFSDIYNKVKNIL
jgi:hypothetical protein